MYDAPELRDGSHTLPLVIVSLAFCVYGWFCTVSIAEYVPRVGGQKPEVIGRTVNGHYIRYIFSDFRSSMIVTNNLPHYLRSYPLRSAWWCCRWQTVAFVDKLRQTALLWEWGQAEARCPTL